MSATIVNDAFRDEHLSGAFDLLSMQSGGSPSFSVIERRPLSTKLPLQTLYTNPCFDDDNERCALCGYTHKNGYHSPHSTNASGGCPYQTNAARGKGGCPADKNGSGGGGGDCGGSGSGTGSGGGKDGGGGDGDSNKRSNSSPCSGKANFDTIPDDIKRNMFIAVMVMVVAVSCVVVSCRGYNSVAECLRGGRGCDDITNPNLINALSKSKPTCCGGPGPNGSPIPPHLEGQYKEFKDTLRKGDCLQKNSIKCPGVPNYAGFLASGKILSIRDTVYVQSRERCKCKDFDKRDIPCSPSASNCSRCACDAITADTLINEETIIPGKCWSFAGEGKVLIGFFFPIYVTGVTIHHPLKAQLPPGFFTSAPKDFELWGYNGIDDKEPFLFGRFEYKSDALSTQTYEVINLASKPYNSVQLNFLTNYGNKNYTAVYKVEVHGLLDHTVTKYP